MGHGASSAPRAEALMPAFVTGRKASFCLRLSPRDGPLSPGSSAVLSRNRGTHRAPAWRLAWCRFDQG